MGFVSPEREKVWADSTEANLRGETNLEMQVMQVAQLPTKNNGNNICGRTLPYIRMKYGIFE